MRITTMTVKTFETTVLGLHHIVNMHQGGLRSSVHTHVASAIYVKPVSVVMPLV